jgi:lipopolysaccharide/colanic/teichoic acid biosynthesis glycosyltransferase
VTSPPRAGIPRWLEAVAAGCSLLALTPVLAILAVGVALSSAGPVLFRQERIGRQGRRFTMFKFRSMRVNGRGPAITAQGDDRVTAFGRYLRKTKLDELPEFWNVLRGDMSLVGARPEVPPYVDFENPAWREVLQWRPGLTDPVTVELRNEEELIESVEGDRDTYYRSVLLPYKLDGYLRYLRERSFRSDIHVLWTTLAAVLLPRTVQAPPRPPSQERN